MRNFFVIVIIMATCTFATAQQDPSPSASIGSRSRGNSFNPDIGINSLMLYQNSNRGNDALTENRNGFGLQEAELQFSADVDPYWRFVSTFALRQEVEIDNTTTPATRNAEYVFEPEELFAESLDLPWITLRAGKFKAAFGRHNILHTHAFPFIDAPLVNQVLLGDEGLNDSGISVAGLLPTSWFSEITLQGLSGQGEGVDYYHGASANDSVGLFHWKNLWDLSEDLTLELGGSAATGKNSTARTTNLSGADLTFKWRGSRSKALIWSTEYLARDRNEATNERGRGFASWIQYQFAQRWWAQLRGEYLEVKNQDPASPNLIPQVQRKQSILIGFIPSEFSGIRLQYDHLDDGAAEHEQKIMLQLNYSIGAHPAHSY